MAQASLRAIVNRTQYVPEVEFPNSLADKYCVTCTALNGIGGFLLDLFFSLTAQQMTQTRLLLFSDLDDSTQSD